jgi:hypothetical protein
VDTEQKRSLLAGARAPPLPDRVRTSRGRRRRGDDATATEEVGGLHRATRPRRVEGRFEIDRMVGHYEALYRRVSRGAR